MNPANRRPLAERPVERVVRGMNEEMMIAALFVKTAGAYFGISEVDPWDEAKDARRYTGPSPVVAHPPCQR